MFLLGSTGLNQTPPIMTKQAGIWIDKRTAKIVTLAGESYELYEVHSEIEEFRPKGGSGTRMKGGPQDVVQDSKYLEREKHQHRTYFRQIAEQLVTAEAVVIFGPAQTGEKLHQELSDSYPQLAAKVKAVEKADSMTDNQVVAWVREYYAG